MPPPFPSPQSLKAQGRLSLDKVLELREAGVPVTDILGDGERQKLYRDEVRGGAGPYRRDTLSRPLRGPFGKRACPGAVLALVEQAAVSGLCINVRPRPVGTGCSDSMLDLLSRPGGCPPERRHRRLLARAHAGAAAAGGALGPLLA
jgi:hypothetical protein